MKVGAVKCPKCGDIIYSRAVHDFHSCTCGAVSIDGGFEYMRVGGYISEDCIVSIEVKATKAQLYQDWNKMTDKFGLIKGNGITRAIAKTKKGKKKV